jgi:hypothetical protein
MRKSLLVFLTLCLILSLTTLAQQSSSDVPVTSTIYDSALMHIRSDGASYSTITSKKGYVVKSVIQGFGNWELDTGINVTNTTRKVSLCFSEPIPGTGPDGSNPISPFSPVDYTVVGVVQPKFLSEASRYGNSMFTIPEGVTVLAPLLIGFDYNGNRYRIHMTPDDNSLYPYPETDYVNITCTGAGANSQCNRWQITAEGTKGCAPTDNCLMVKKNIVRLVKVVTSKGKVTEINQGNFYMAFSFDITKP